MSLTHSIEYKVGLRILCDLIANLQDKGQEVKFTPSNLHSLGKKNDNCGSIKSSKVWDESMHLLRENILRWSCAFDQEVYVQRHLNLRWEKIWVNEVIRRKGAIEKYNEHNIPVKKRRGSCSYTSITGNI